MIRSLIIGGFVRKVVVVYSYFYCIFYNQNSKDFIMPSKNFTDHDIANLLLTAENNSEDDLWSDDEGSK
jgi:hypothetical protein